jgi:hypothetical protein
MAEQPRGWGTPVFRPDNPQRVAAELFRFPKENFHLVITQCSRPTSGMQLAPPKNFIRHPITHTRKALLL